MATPRLSPVEQPSGRDGRAARSARTRLAIVEALRSLHLDGELRPTAARVAERAGVSPRTVWQHFDDREALLVEAGRRDAEIALGYSPPIDPSLPLAERIAALVDQRRALFEALAPVWRAARLELPFSPQIRRNGRALLDAGRRQLAALFAPELDRLVKAEREPTLHALLAATSWAVWEDMRAESGLSAAQAERAVLTLVTRLLTSA